MTLSEIHSVVPKHFHEKNTLKAFGYVLRDVLCAVAVYKLGWMTDPFSRSLVENFGLAPKVGTLVNWLAWIIYWHCQGVILAGWWCMAHEAGHGTLSSYNWVNHFIGFTLHTVRTYFRSSCPLTDGLFSLFSYHTTHGDRLTMLTTKRRCPLNVMKTLFLELALIMDSPQNLQLYPQTTMIFLRKHLFILSFVWVSCNFSAGNIIFLPMLWARRCIPLAQM